MTKIVKKDYSKIALTTYDAIRETHKTASAGRTPPSQVKRRPDGYDYVTEAYMRKKLNDFYPGWSWEIDKHEFLGAEWVVVRGTLYIADCEIPRKFSAPGAKRIQFKRGTEHVPANILDIGNNIKAASSDAFKTAVNRLCNIADDVYRKHIESELTNKQKETIAILFEEIKEHCISDKELKDHIALTEKVTKQVESGSIHSANYKAAINRLKQILKQKKEKKDE